MTSIASCEDPHVALPSRYPGASEDSFVLLAPRKRFGEKLGSGLRILGPRSDVDCEDIRVCTTWPALR